MQIFKNAIKTLSLLLVFTMIAFTFYQITHNTTFIDTFYILCVLLVARFTSGYVWGIFAAIFGVVGLNYFFTYPFFEINFTLSGYPVTFIGMLSVSIITSTLTAHVKEQCRITAQNEKSLNLLNDINTKLILTDHISQIIELALYNVAYSTHASCIFYTKDPLYDNEPSIHITNEEDTAALSSESQRILAHSAYFNKKVITNIHSSKNTLQDTAPSYMYLPVTSHDTIWGVLGLYCENTAHFIADSTSFLNLMLPQIALALESQTLVDSQQKLAIESEKEKMRANLLRAISHDLRTPLTTIIGASATYLENHAILQEQEKTQLISQIHEDANWLLHMVENLLSVTRITDKSTQVVKKLEPLEEVISESVSRVKKRCQHIQLKVTVPDEFIMVPMDATLIEQVIINLIENALKHAKTDKPIQLIATKEYDIVKIQVIDQGIGIPPDRMTTLFDGYSPCTNKSSDTSKGMGIGLSICKTIVLAHSGHIWAQNLEQGASFTFTLPLEGADYN